MQGLLGFVDSPERKADQRAATGEARLRDVTWGEGTEDEMCSMTLYVTAN